MSELFHTNYEKDNFTTFEVGPYRNRVFTFRRSLHRLPCSYDAQQQFIRRALIGGSDEQLPLLSWFAPLQGCVGVAELYVAEYAVEGGADVSDFIAAAGRMALDVSQVHAQYATEAKDGQKRRELLMTNALRDVTIRFLQGHFALQSKLEAEGQPRSAAASYLETARVANLGDGTAVWICVVSVSKHRLRPTSPLRPVPDNDFMACVMSSLCSQGLSSSSRPQCPRCRRGPLGRAARCGCGRPTPLP